jgi:integrase
MAKNPLKGLFKVKAKGKVYHYAYRGGPRIEAEYGTAEFLQEFLDARCPTAGHDKARFGTWVILYRDSIEYRALSESTKRNWGPMLDRIREHFGLLRVRHFERPDIRQDIKHWRGLWRETPRMADMAKQVLSRVCSFMVDEGVLATNPCEGIANLYQANRSDLIWTPEDLDQLCASASPEIGHAARLAACTGLRKGDLLRLAWSRVGDLAIDLKTGKSRGRRSVLIPVTAGLRAVLAGIPKRASTVLTNTHGKPWRGGFGSSWADAVDRAGLADRDLHFHDLRGTAATNFYRAGFTSREIADILGWSPERVEQLIDRYVKRDELLRDRIRRLEQLENEDRKTGSKTRNRE